MSGGNPRTFASGRGWGEKEKVRERREEVGGKEWERGREVIVEGEERRRKGSSWRESTLLRKFLDPSLYTLQYSA